MKRKLEIDQYGSQFDPTGPTRYSPSDWIEISFSESSPSERSCSIGAHRSPIVPLLIQTHSGSWLLRNSWLRSVRSSNVECRNSEWTYRLKWQWNTSLAAWWLAKKRRGIPTFPWPSIAFSSNSAPSFLLRKRCLFQIHFSSQIHMESIPLTTFSPTADDSIHLHTTYSTRAIWTKGIHPWAPTTTSTAYSTSPGRESGKADSRIAVDSILFFLCSWLFWLEWMCSSVLSLREAVYEFGPWVPAIPNKLPFL